METSIIMRNRLTSHKPSYNFHNRSSKDWWQAGGRRLLGRDTVQSLGDVSEMQV